MKNYNKLSYILATIIAIVSISTSCVTADDTLGNNIVPGENMMTIGTATLDHAELFETRLYQTDSIIVSGLSAGFMGSMHDDTTGYRSAGFLTQFKTYSKVDSGYFGYRPFLDSVLMILDIINSGADTITPQTFNVYEVTNNDYLTESKDSIFYLNFNPTKYVDQSTPLFTFELPNKTTNTSGHITVTLNPTEKGVQFIERLMISNGTNLVDPDIDYTIYTDEESDAWFNEFKGLYIIPKQQILTGTKGTIYTASFSSSGFIMYCRNRDIEDPTLIKDTVDNTYYFHNYSNNTSLQTITTVTRDYTGSEINIADAEDKNKNRPINTDIYVDGMGGVLTEITFGETFFTEIQSIIDKTNEESDENYNSIAFNRADMKIYFSQADHNWENIFAPDIYQMMDASISRFGLYSNFVDLTGVLDYDYNYEISLGSTLPYDGYINRSHGCYTLNISAYLQSLWSSYLELKESSGGKDIDYSQIENRSVYLAPEAVDLFTTKHAKLPALINVEGKQNTMKIDLVYTLIK